VFGELGLLKVCPEQISPRAQKNIVIRHDSREFCEPPMPWRG
jgi:hypothetical protein